MSAKCKAGGVLGVKIHFLQLLVKVFSMTAVSTSQKYILTSLAFVFTNWKVHFLWERKRL